MRLAAKKWVGKPGRKGHLERIMKGSLMGLLAGLVLVCASAAQVVVPASPKRMVTRSTGGSTTTGEVSISSSDGSAEQKVRYTTHVVLADARQWTSADGRTLQAKLIAFEDLVVETPKGAPQPAAAAPPATITVIRDGKIRLVSTQKPFELALDRLSQDDREFVARISAAHAKKPLPTPP